MTEFQIKRFGWRRDRLDHRDQKLSISGPVFTLPSSFDMRLAAETAGLLPPVYDQGDEGSCTANAGAAVIDFERKRQGLPFLTPSRQFLYYNTRALEGTTEFDAGGEIRDVIKTLAAQGVCPETEWPYEDGNLTTKPSPQCYSDALKLTALAYSSINQTAYAIKYMLARKKRPVIYGMSVFAQIQSAQAAQNGVIAMPGANEAPIGGHAVDLVGYNDRSREFVFRNSWGSGWGDQGYGYISYDYILDPTLSSDFWVILGDAVDSAPVAS